MTPRPRKIIAGLVATLMAACSLTVDEAELGGERDLACSDRQKACSVEGVVRCVGLDDPNFGCARRNCIPCSLPTATAICSPASGECVVGACIGTWEDCDRSNANGCEVNVADDVNHCGKCGQPCPPVPNAEVACGSSSCYIRMCDFGFKDCNKDSSDGCEIDAMTDPHHCGACERLCAGSCTGGTCQPS